MSLAPGYARSPTAEHRLVVTNAQTVFVVTTTWVDTGTHITPLVNTYTCSATLVALGGCGCMDSVTCRQLHIYMYTYMYRYAPRLCIPQYMCTSMDLVIFILFMVF